MMRHQILLIEDDDALRLSLAQAFDLEGFKVIQASNFDQARRTIRANFNGVILSDIRMPGRDGFEILQHAQNADPDLPVILLTGQGDVPMALRAMRQGAYDFIEKPCKVDYLIEVLKRALEQRRLVLHNRKIERDLARNDLAAVNFPGNTAATKDLRKAIRLAAANDAHIHIYGPLGIGRRIAAHTIHKLSEQQSQFFSLTLAEGELQKLAQYTQSKQHFDILLRDLEQADDETLRDIAEIAKQNSHLRLITSSVKSMQELQEQTGSKQLFSTLKSDEIKIPTLGRRREDIPEIFEALVRQAVRTKNANMPEITEKILTRVLTGKWSKNLIDLRVLANEIVTENNQNIKDDAPLTLAQRMDSFERLNLIESLKKHSGQATAAAAELGMPRKTFYDRLKRYSLQPKDYG